MASSRRSVYSKKELTSNVIFPDPTGFSLPESLPSSEISLPKVVTKPKANWNTILKESNQEMEKFNLYLTSKTEPKANWNAILKECNQEMEKINVYLTSKTEPLSRPSFQWTENNYIEQNVFNVLLPALEETLNKAKLWNALVNQRSFFNGVDWIAQVLWNSNPLYSHRQYKKLHIFNMPWVRECLKQNPRPLYPKSWLWNEEYAAICIQKWVRQYFVQREEDVQELRNFWKKLAIEKMQHDEYVSNPFYAKKFAQSK